MPPLVVCIGPVTSKTARKRGVTVAAVADPHTLDGLVSALVAVLRRPDPPA
ncbi:MAG: uroporphyrinogen-III synthase [Actinomycetota bacterium]|nr:uroporphyrinogen-III synthase [Actinomycetota bacterium]